jgi:hypothetical protein
MRVGHAQVVACIQGQILFELQDQESTTELDSMMLV